MQVFKCICKSVFAITIITASLILPGCGSTSTSSPSPEVQAVLNALYVCATGDNSNPSDGTCAHAFNAAGFSAPANWGVGENKINAGDIVIIKDDGGDYASTFTIQGSGTAGNIITVRDEAGDSPVIDLNNSADYCFRATDKEFISITGVTCQEASESGFRFDNTGPLDTITITDITCDNVMQNCIWIEGSAGNLFSNITISDSAFTRWSQEANYGDGANKTNHFQTAAIAIAWADTISIDKNLISTTSCTPRRGGCGNGIVMIEVTNAVTEYNEIQTLDVNNTPGGHGIYIKCDGSSSCTGTGNITRYNYLHDMGDDCFWSDNQTDNPLYYGNICIDTYDDCTDIRGSWDGLVTGTGKVLNNTCINFASTGIQASGTTTVTYQNNIYIANVDDCATGDSTQGFPCFVVFEDPADWGYAVMAGNTFNNNIYYNLSGNGDVESFVASDLDSGTYMYQNDPPNGDAIRGTFAQWQADDSAPDAASLITQPNVSLTTGISGSTGPQKDAGIDQCAIFQEVLHEDTVWSVGTAPRITSVCPVTVDDKWDIGATRMNRSLP